ncbi:MULTISPECIES: sugar porter family MFS transporter [Serratia]|jgi:SP family xylose:H+ symportor-like MFS transporter|uniref:D-xylose-proton symporter n=1 Tax=Serratia fonticola TaxID=47917 RepID=A0A0F7D1D7_SERFO|nr:MULTISPECIES: sugar porter family MFS transporter [Serratia]AKG68805.1 D-xylose-proton symporter [Serratia fonticola]AYM92920.1 MFS transporter [Serratia sp. 3ACOL1]MBL5825826.1 sugar porter family MFS transporter [Serratia fonticola]MBL5861440.1 sugar porter family MFS transporter [Serratia fonticola]MDK2377150.1 sugar porter family MFS transporter [Serratia fonticola]
MSHQRKHNTGYILRICGIAALGGILFGYDTAVISGAIEALKTYFDLSPAETGWAVSNVVIGCVVGAFGAGPLAGRYGRKKALVVAAFLFTVSAVGAALATTFTWFVIYRIIGGLAVGLAATVSPMYMSEVSPKDMRGRALSMQQFAIVFGQIVIFYVNFKIASYASEAWLVEMGWRWMIGSEVIPCLLFTALVFVIPESPRWSVMVGRDDQALAMLTRVSNAEHAKSVLREIKESLRQDEQHRKQKLNYGDVRVRFILFVGCMIAMLQQVTGVNVMMYYAPVVLKTVTENAQEALFQTIWIGVLQLVGSVIGAMLMDRIGRIPLMRWGTLGTIVGLLITSYALYTQATGYFALFGMLFFMVFYAMSWGVGAWVLVSEIFPNRMRSQGMSIAVGCMWLANFVVAQSFPMINDQPYLFSTFHGAFPMWVFAACCLFSYWFIARFIPETKGVSLERMEDVVMAKRYRQPLSEIVTVEDGKA